MKAIPPLLRRRAATFILLLVAAAWLLTSGRLLAFVASGTIEGIDAAGGVLKIHANGQDHTVAIAGDVKVTGTDGKSLAGGLTSLKAGLEVTVTLVRGESGPVVQAIQLGGNGALQYAAAGGKSSIGLKPLTEMTAQDRYKGQDGGLYGGGSNAPPPLHLAAARQQTGSIIPLDVDGKPAKEGRIGLVSISMSNATQEFSLFKELADVDCAQGGQAMAQWVDPNAPAWAEADRRLQRAGLGPKQVQVIWVKLANVMPRGDLAEHGGKLQRDTMAVLHNAKARFPNVRIAYLGSRIYGGYAVTPLNPEPYAYEGAFVVRWLIQDQIKGNPELRYEPIALASVRRCA
jgi:hypothetical protein